jgi:branched-chain amino acid transport system substrate-binding protein
MRSVIVSAALCALTCCPAVAQDVAQPRIKIGVPTALSGSASPWGSDIRNALTIANEVHAGGRYELIFEDERCDNRTAVSVAHKLITIDKVRYALGFPCNSTLIATAPIYSKSGVVVITSAATSGDVPNVGEGIFQLFPSDVDAASLVSRHMAKANKRVGILTEQNEFTVMMDRGIRRENERAGKPLEIVSEEFVHGETDLKTVLLRLVKGRPDAIYISANSEESFIAAIRQLRALRFSGRLYTAYLPASETPRTALGTSLNGITFVNLPHADELVTPEGKVLMTEFRKRFGEPQAGFPIVPLTFEAFRVLDAAIRRGESPREWIASTRFSGGFIPDFHFATHGAVQGIGFQMQRIEDGKVVVLKGL